jgi:hypothetical protein
MIGNNTQTVQDGLVLHLDAANPKSYTGPAIKNVLTQISPSSIYDNGSTFRAFSGTEDVFIPGVGNIPGCNYADWYNDYNGGSGNCCPSMFNFGTSLPLVGSQLYTYAILYRSVNRYTNPNLMYHYEYGPSGYLTEFGVHNGGYTWQETHLGNGWYWSRAKFTSNASATVGHFYTFMYQYATWNRLYVAKVALMPGDFMDLHPKYWPELGSTKSADSSAKDLTGNHVLTTSNLAYANNSAFNWNAGIDAKISSASSSAFAFGTGDFTIDCWINPTNFNSYTHMVALPDQNTFALKANVSDGAIYFYSPGFNTYPISGWTLSSGTWNHVVLTRVGGTAYCYLNGELKGSKSGFTNSLSPQPLNIGNGYSNEYTAKAISSVKIYNIGLNSQQIKQNFNALRGRYGL